MARFSRVEVINTLLDVGVLPLFYAGEVEPAAAVVQACAQGGARLVEFTHRGEAAYAVFAELARRLAGQNPDVILGVGSILDAPTAALFLAAGANFIVGPSFNPEIARLCNRRKVLYMPGCATETEISTAEEYGAEICKLFPGEAAGGPAFIKAVMAPCPWHRLLPTGGVAATPASIGAWIAAGAAGVGLGSQLISPALLQSGNFAGLAESTAQCLAWVRQARANLVAGG